MRQSIFFVKEQSWVRRVPKEVDELVTVNHHGNTNVVYCCHREWPVVTCDNCCERHSGVVVVYGDGGVCWCMYGCGVWWCMYGCGVWWCMVMVVYGGVW